MYMYMQMKMEMPRACIHMNRIMAHYIEPLITEPHNQTDKQTTEHIHNKDKQRSL
jgi:hypothetical protein